LTFKKYGIVLNVQDGIVLATGLKTVGLTEVVTIKKKIKGMVSTLERDYVRICLMGSEKEIQPGDVISRTERYITVPVGFSLLGRVVNSLGRPIDGKGKLTYKTGKTFTIKDLKKAFQIYLRNFDMKNRVAPTDDETTNTIPKKPKQKRKPRILKRRQLYKVNLQKSLLMLNPFFFVTSKPIPKQYIIKRKFKTLKIERAAPGIMDRKSIHQPLITGTKVIDGVIPIGRGQRELILGDRNTGKTTLAIDAIISQTKHNKENFDDKIYSIYVAVGQRQSKVQDVVNTLKHHNSFKNTIVVFAPSYAPAILQFIAPYSGTTIGEFFRDKGYHALVIYDDLTKHAQIHRQLSLLLKTPPGREAYPGDIFLCTC